MSLSVVEHLNGARLIADYAQQLGVSLAPVPPRITSDHIGAILADSVLQAGLNYRTVVKHRVNRICSDFPEAETLGGLFSLLKYKSVSEFLLWSHGTKISRFTSIIYFLSAHDIDTTNDLRSWVVLPESRGLLLDINGVGPKTFDYLCCLLGIDRVAVDRHVRAFANEAGVTVSDYESLRLIVSYAADLLGMARRDFDSWIWNMFSARMEGPWQLSLF